ncbi:MAG TPA: hypothetical protein VMP01_01005 [Pirellulaceae bacterium]|nr:hypothetical protein [Pirellulaceae bacterium]
MHACRTVVAVCLLAIAFLPVKATAQSASSQIAFLEGHQGAVRDVSITADGRLIVSAGVDGTLRVWNRATGQLLRTVPAHDKPVLQFAASPDGAAVALATADGHVKLLDLPRPHPLAEIGLPAAANLLAATADGQQLFTADGSDVLKQFDLAKRQPVRDFGGATGGVMAIGVYGRTNELLAASGDGMLRGWSLESGQPTASLLLASPSLLAMHHSAERIALAGEDGMLRLANWPPPAPLTLATHGDLVTGVAITPSGKVAIWGSLDQQVLVQVEGSPPRALAAPGGRVTSVAVRDDGTVAAAGLETGLVRFWKVEDGSDAGTLAGHVGAVTHLAFHPREPLIATSGADGSVRIWRQPSPPTSWAGHAQPANVLAVSPDRKLALSAGPDKSVHLWNRADGQRAAGWENLPQAVTAAAFSGDGASAYLGDAVGGVSLRKVTDGQIAWSLVAHPGPIADLQLLADGMLATAGADGQVKVWQLSAIGPPDRLETGSAATVLLVPPGDGSLVVGGSDGSVRYVALADRKEAGRTAAFAKPVSALATSGDGSLLAAGSAGGEVALIDQAERKVTAAFQAHPGPVRAIAIHPREPQFATAGEDGSIRQWIIPQPPQELAGHKAPPRVVTVSPDGKQALSGDAEGAVRLWNLPEGTEAGSLAGGKEPVLSAVWRRDGQQIATGDASGLIRLFQAADGQGQGMIGGHDGGVTGLSFHPNHTQILSSGADGMLRLWQLPLTPPRGVSKVEKSVRGIAVTADGATAVIGSDTGLHAVDVANGQERWAIAMPVRPVAVAISPDHSQTATVTDAGTLLVATIADGKSVAEIGAHAGTASAVAYRPQAGQIATAGSDGQLRLWELPVAPRSFTDHTEKITAAAVSPSGQWLATASVDKTVRIWNLADGSASWTLGHDEPVAAIAWKPDSTQIASAAGKVVRVWNVADGQPAAVLDKHPEAIGAVVFAQDGASLFTGGAGKTIQQWNLADGMLLRTLGEHEKPIRSLILAAGGTVLVSADEAGVIATWNTATAARLQVINTGKAPTAIAGSADGKWLAVGGEKSATVYDLADGALATHIGGLAATPNCLAFSGDSLSLAGGSADGTVRIWNLQGQLQEFIPSSDNPPSALAWLPDHRQVAIGGTKGLVRIHRRALVKALPVSETPVTALAWSADGQFVLSASQDKTIKLWNTTDGALTRQYAGQADAARSLAVTKDGTKVIAGCNDKSLRVWNYSDGGLLATILLPAAPRAIAASADGSRIAAAEPGRVCVWDLATQRMSERLDVAATALVLLADGKQLLLGDAAGVTQQLVLANVAVTVAHTGAAAGAIVTNDGQRWISAGRDQGVKVWDAAGKPLAPLGACDGVPAALAIRADGQQIAIAGADRQIHLWRLDNNQLERKIAAGAGVVSLAYHPTLPKLAAACADGRLRIFNPVDGTLLETMSVASPAACVAFAGERLLAGHENHYISLHAPSLERIIAGHQVLAAGGAVTCLSYSADGSGLFSGGSDMTVRQWNSADGAAVRTVLTAADAITGLALAEDGSRLIAASADKTIRVFNAADGAAVATLNAPMPIRAFAGASGGALLAVSGDDGQIHLWDAKTGVIRESISGLSIPAASLAISSDGKQVIAAAGNEPIYIWPLACTLQIAADPVKVYELAATPDGQLVTTGDDKTVKLWDAAGNLVRLCGGSPFATRSVAVRPDGAQIIAGGDPTQAQPILLAWNAADGQAQFQVTLPSPIIRVVYLDAKRIAVACVDQKVRILNAADGKPLEEIAVPAAMTAMAAGDEGQFLVATAANPIYPLAPALVQMLPPHEGGASAVAWSPSGSGLFSAGADKLIRQWDASTGKLLRTLAGSPAPVTSLAIAPDGQHLLAVCGEAQLRTWQWDGSAAADGSPLQPQEAQTPANLRSVALTGDGQRIVTGSDDGQVRLSDRASGKEIERFAGHTGPVTSVAISADGKAILSGGADRTVRRFGLTLTHVAAGLERTTAVAIGPDGAGVITGGSAGEVTSWSLADLSRGPDYQGATGPIRAVAVTKSGDLLAAGGDDSHLWIWRAADGALLADVMTHTPITTIRFAQDGRRAIVAGADGILRHYDLSQANEKLTVSLVLQARGHVGAVRHAVVAGDERHAISIGADAKIDIWSIADSQSRWTRELGKLIVHQVAFRADGSELAAACGDGHLRTLSAVDGAVVRDWPAHEGPVQALAWRADGQELASAGRDGAIRLWDLEGKESAKIVAGSEALQAVAWSADGSLLHSGGRSKQWQTFQRASLERARQAEGHNQPIVDLRYSANGQRVATLDDTGKLFVWDAANGTPLFHQQLAVAAAYRLAWSPDASEIVVATSDPRIIRLTIPLAAR